MPLSESDTSAKLIDPVLHIRGYLSAARKKGVKALAALCLAFDNQPFLPEFVTPLA